MYISLQNYQCSCQSSASFSCDLQAEPSWVQKACKAVMDRFSKKAQKYVKALVSLFLLSFLPEWCIGTVHVRLHLRNTFLKLLQYILQHIFHWEIHFWNISWETCAYKISCKIHSTGKYS